MNLYALLQAAVLAYFAVLHVLSMAFGWLGLRSMAVFAREASDDSLRDLESSESYLPVSVIVPACNEERSIVESVRSFLGLRFPAFEVIVVVNGSTDGTVQRLEEAFALVEAPQVPFSRIRSATPLRILRSPHHLNLLVVEKKNGGKADALNTGLNLARLPLVCAVDADSLLEPEALLRTTRFFLNDERVVAVGGSIRPLNGAVVEDGRVTSLKLPRRWIERFQVVEYARSFFTGRVGWGSYDALLIISGAFGVFRRESLLAVGGYERGTVGEDLEVVLRLHRYYRDRKLPYRILSVPAPMCWTEVPSDFASLRRQRNRWQRGLWESLWRHRDLFGNPRYGRIGLVAVPFLWIFEGAGPLVEILGLLLVPVSFVFGVLDVEFALLFLLLAVGFGMLISLTAVGVEMLLATRYESLVERVLLLVTSVAELLGFRQILALERLVASLQVWSKRGHWGQADRVGIDPGRQVPAGEKAPAAAPADEGDAAESGRRSA